MRKASLTCITATVFGRTAKDEENDKLAIKSIGSNNVIRRHCVLSLCSSLSPSQDSLRLRRRRER